MPGTVIVKPLAANFDNDLNIELTKETSPYCVVKVGDKKVRGLACKKGGKYPFWRGTFHVPRNEEHFCFIEIKNHELAPHEVIGVSKIDLDEIDKEGNSTKWYDVYYHKKAAGQILIEVKMENTQQGEQFLEFNEPEGREISPIKPVPGLSKQDSGFDLPIRTLIEKPHLKGRGSSNNKSGFYQNKELNNSSEDIDKNGLSGVDFSYNTGNDGDTSETFKEGPADENISKVDLGDSLPLIKDEDLAETNIVVTKEAGNLNASAYV